MVYRNRGVSPYRQTRWRLGTAAHQDRKGPPMTIENIHVTDTDSLDAAADLLELRESYGDYCARMADEHAEEWMADNGIDPDDDTHEYAQSTYNPDRMYRTSGLSLIVVTAPATDEPEPPEPGAPAPALAVAAPCVC